MKIREKSVDEFNLMIYILTKLKKERDGHDTETGDSCRNAQENDHRRETQIPEPITKAIPECLHGAKTVLRQHSAEEKRKHKRYLFCTKAPPKEPFVLEKM